MPNLIKTTLRLSCKTCRGQTISHLTTKGASLENSHLNERASTLLSVGDGDVGGAALDALATVLRELAAPVFRQLTLKVAEEVALVLKEGSDLLVADLAADGAAGIRPTRFPVVEVVKLFLLRH